MRNIFNSFNHKIIFKLLYQTATHELFPNEDKRKISFATQQPTSYLHLHSTECYGTHKEQQQLQLF